MGGMGDMKIGPRFEILVYVADPLLIFKNVDLHARFSIRGEF